MCILQISGLKGVHIIVERHLAMSVTCTCTLLELESSCFPFRRTADQQCSL